jgi:hypothetical protein
MPTGTSVTVDDQPTINGDLGIERLIALLAD